MASECFLFSNLKSHKIKNTEDIMLVLDDPVENSVGMTCVCFGEVLLNLGDFTTLYAGPCLY